MSINLSIRPTAPLQTAKISGAVLNMVKKVFQRSSVANIGAVADTKEVWQLYRMTRGSDSVPQAVTATLSHMAG
jgi:hypothetical protein